MPRKKLNQMRRKEDTFFKKEEKKVPMPIMMYRRVIPVVQVISFGVNV